MCSHSDKISTIHQHRKPYLQQQPRAASVLKLLQCNSAISFGFQIASPLPCSFCRSSSADARPLNSSLLLLLGSTVTMPAITYSYRKQTNIVQKRKWYKTKTSATAAASTQQQQQRQKQWQQQQQQKAQEERRKSMQKQSPPSRITTTIRNELCTTEG